MLSIENELLVRFIIGKYIKKITTKILRYVKHTFLKYLKSFYIVSAFTLIKTT